MHTKEKSGSEPVLLREREVIQRYGLGGPFLRKRRRLGLEPIFVKVGRCVFYRVRDLENWLEKGAIHPGQRRGLSAAAGHEAREVRSR